MISRDEFNDDGILTVRRVLRRFERIGPVLDLTVNGQRIGTTHEHPFFVKGQGWTKAHELRIGDQVRLMQPGWATVEAVEDTGRLERVYNLEIEDDHTYFVGCDEWGWAVWAHNADLDSYLHGVVPARLPDVVEGFAVPYGFKTAAEYRAFVQRLRAGLPDGAEPIFQGSSVTGRKFKTTDSGKAGDAFDFGRRSDYDIGVVHDTLFDMAELSGLLRTKSAPPRIGPVKFDGDLARELGLRSVLEDLTTMAGRKVEFNLYKTLQDARKSAPSIFVPGGMFGG